MAMTRTFAAVEPPRKEIDALQEPTVIEFGTDWCGFCRAAQPLLETAFAGHSAVNHIKIEDGPGRPLGRSFRVKLWPTLVFMKNGAEVARVVRPADANEIRQALEQIDAGA